LNVGSLFSGIGGLEIGFKKQGYTIEYFVEQDAYCGEILRKNFPGIPIYGDITTIDFRKLPKVDVLTGGFPCQDISIAGKHKGIEGGRSSLWKEYARAINECKPRYAIIENSPLLASRGLETVLQNLSEMRYDAEWSCLQASWFGNFQKRERMFIVAYLPMLGLVHSWYDSCYSKGIKRFFSEIPVERRTIGDKERLQEQIRTTEFIRNRNGIPYRVDRIRCCGNAVIPEVSEWIAKRLKEFEEERVKKSDVL
jgi:DNA (cytosine-5)-methyltransferase 1